MTAILISCVAVILAFVIVILYRRHTKQLLKNLNRMLDIAIQGEFTEEIFDESLLSAVETKLARYLAASTVSARNLREEKDKIKTLIADISHQTKTPISNILLYTQLLSEQELTEQNHACVLALESQTEKLRTLIEALVKTARLESGVIALHPIPGPLSPILESAASQLALRAQAKSIRLTVTTDSTEAVCDPKWTEEAVYNLLDNAVKYTPAGGQISIRTVAYPLFACICVTDTGPGIPEEEQPKIFQRFYRGMEYQNDEGVGIGLYLVRQIAEGQGGYIKVRSKPGEGAEFSIYLPRT